MKAYIGKYKKDGKRTVRIEITKDDVINLDDTIALIMVPLLQAFKEKNVSYPLGQNPISWDEILDKMIQAFKLKTEGKEDSDSREIISEGLAMFNAYYHDLWI